jgi:hypothetical protein
MAQANMWHIFMIALSSILIEAKHALKNAINEFQNTVLNKHVC